MIYPGVMCADDEHVWSAAISSDNADRTRTYQRCLKCWGWRYGTLAKRLDPEGHEAWGPVGQWTHEVVPSDS